MNGRGYVYVECSWMADFERIGDTIASVGTNGLNKFREKTLFVTGRLLLAMDKRDTYY